MEEEQWQPMGIDGTLTVPIRHAAMLHPNEAIAH